MKGDLHKKRSKYYKDVAVEQSPPTPKIDTRVRPGENFTHISFLNYNY